MRLGYHWMKRFGCLLFCLGLMGCASTPAPVSEVATSVPVVSEPVVEPVQPEPVEVVPEVSPAIQALRDSMGQQNYPEAELRARTIIDAAPKSGDAAEALRILAEISMASGKLSEAQLYADAAYAISSKDVKTLICLARLAILHEQMDVAVKHLKEAVEVSPRDSQPHVMLATILLQFLDVERALEAAQKAYELAPHQCSAVVVYADALYATRAFTESIAQYELAERQGCQSGEETLKNMAKLYEVHVQNAQKACASYQRLHAMSPDNPYYKASMDYQCGLTP